MSPTLPASLPIEPRGPLDALVHVPGSKSITNRALPLAALAEGTSTLTGGLTSDDTVVMREALGALGAVVDTGGETGEEPWRVVGTGGRLKLPDHPIYIENSGTSARFLTAILTLAPGPVELDGNARMRERPISQLTEALGALGGAVEILGADACPPVRVLGGGLAGGHVCMDASASSQYVSAILMAAPYAREDVRITFQGGIVVSRPYVDLTLQVMRAFGVTACWDEEAERLGAEPSLFVAAGQRYGARDYAVEPDASSAAYPFCAAAIAGGRVRVAGIPADSIQADLAILELLERMGCRVRREAGSAEVEGPKHRLRSLGEVNMNALPDAALAYAVVALFADGPTTITDVANLRIKETDRLAALETELRRLGARAEAGPDWLRIEPGPLRGAEIETYDDHRMAMSFALAGLRIPGVVILDPGCVSKTWPDFFEAFRGL
jgi:3-phosphoshikimate 1-carboxyvinyltransferase